ncbi:MAG: PhoH family protein [Desulfobulbaceae bacterium]|uniref:PhoH-like protein n=1 Tax=Candidatus Desulfatifera sulfidica TaxID=2841691 RepID=A0A8J6N8Y1_9BACT|nr:PhoH family protein [Candidatus Desulfatifera sulfidica]
MQDKNNPKKISRELHFGDNTRASLIYGELNRNLLLLEKSSGVTINARGADVTISGLAHSVELAAKVLEQLYDLSAQGFAVYSTDFAFGLRVLEANPAAQLAKIFLDKVYITAQNRVVSPRTQNQKLYIDAIRQNDIVFGIGPAGTGKTYLAVAMAVAALTTGQVRSIILTRPAIEAGEKLGFLPGDLAQKINPYLRPLYDALNDMLGNEKSEALIEEGIIEIAPLAFMRGRTLNNAFIILDEAQNTTQEQMKMFLTRIGFDSQAVVTGDITQIDLPDPKRSGLIHSRNILRHLEGIAFSTFTRIDVVRHPLVQKIIQAYDKKTVKREKTSDDH